MHRQSRVDPAADLAPLEKRLLNDYQHGLPLVPRPFAAIAERLGVSEQEVIDTLQALRERGFVSRVGAVFRANSIGASTLAAMAVPEAELETVAEIVNGYREVNHNYQREHRFNLWFVVTAEDEAALARVLDDIERRTGRPQLRLPMLADYHIDLGFELQWT